MRILAVALVALVILSVGVAGASAYTAPPPSPGLIEIGEKVAKEAVERRQHEEAEAAARKAAEERAPVEAREREQKEQVALEEKRAQEIAAQEAGEQRSPPVACRVPSLKGHTLTVARRLLARAHCSLGRVHAQRGNRAAEVVVGQGMQAGMKRAAGTAVTVTLARHK